MNILKNFLSYIKSVHSELKKVIWPKREDVVKLTSIVLTVSIFVGLYVGLLDFAFTKALETIINK